MPRTAQTTESEAKERFMEEPGRRGRDWIIGSDQQGATIHR